MSSSPKVSVLVAVYNASPWLAECLDSLLRQTLSDIQVVCIDDGSTDGSLQILRDYAGRDPRIEVVSLDSNHGQAFARNVGLSRVKAPLVCFLDADDWFSPDALQQAAQVFDDDDEADCVLFRLMMVTPSGSHPYQMQPFDVLTGREAFLQSIDWRIHGVYMVRTGIHRRYPYDDTCRSYSDDNTTRLHYYVSRHVRCCQGVYFYRQLPTSTSHQVSVRRFEYLRANESMKRQLLDLHVPEAVLCQWETIRMLVLVDVYMFYHRHGRQLPADERRWGLSEMKRVWQTIEVSRLDKTKTSKFGYRHCSSWFLFRLQEWLYFTLRGIIGAVRAAGR